MTNTQRQQRPRDNVKSQKARPFLKWAGGKTQLLSQFEALYPRAYSGLLRPRDRLKRVYKAAVRRVRSDLQTRRLTITRVMDSDILLPVLAAKCAAYWADDGEDDMEKERETYANRYDDEFETLCADPVWVDSNVNKTEEEEENAAHPHFSLPSW